MYHSCCKFETRLLFNRVLHLFSVKLQIFSTGPAGGSAGLCKRPSDPVCCLQQHNSVRWRHKQQRGKIRLSKTIKLTIFHSTSCSGVSNIYLVCALGKKQYQQWRTQEFCSGGGQQIQLRTEDRENGDLGAVAP